MGALLVVALIVVPLAEIWTIIQVAHVIGGWPTIVLLFAESLLGAWLVRREGRRAWQAFRSARSSSTGRRRGRSATPRWSCSAGRCCSRRAS